MSRFADPTVTARLDLGPCQCPGTPHASDYIEMRTELGARDVLAVATGDSLDALATLIVGWNLLDNDGTPAPVDRDHIDRLYADSFDALNGWIEGRVRVSSLPNGSGAPSADGSPESAYPTPTILENT
jgi:hypothetical protein